MTKWGLPLVCRVKLMKLANLEGGRPSKTASIEAVSQGDAPFFGKRQLKLEQKQLDCAALDYVKPTDRKLHQESYPQRSLRVKMLRMLALLMSADGKERPSEITSIISTSKKLEVEDVNEHVM